MHTKLYLKNRFYTYTQFFSYEPPLLGFYNYLFCFCTLEHRTDFCIVILQVKRNVDSMLSSPTSNFLPNISNVMPPYLCGQKNCSMMVMFSDDFVNHVLASHPNEQLLCSLCAFKPKTTVDLLQHMQHHGIWFCHCRYCKFGSTTVDAVYMHIALNHPSLEPEVVVRQFMPVRV